MRSVNFRRTLVGAAVAAALGVLGNPATAAPYRGTFDPPSFFGEYTINVSPACLAQSDGWYANVDGSLCDATLLSSIAEVHPPNTYNGVLTFGPVSSQAELFGLYIVDGKIDSFDSAMIHHASGVPDPSPQEFWIQFTSGHACYGYPCSPPPPPCNYPAICIDVAPAGVSQFDPTQRGVYLFNSLTGSPIDMAQFVGPAQDIGIPEPGTLSLLLGALGGGWLARRRRKEKVPDTS